MKKIIVSIVYLLASSASYGWEVLDPITHPTAGIMGATVWGVSANEQYQFFFSCRNNDLVLNTRLKQPWIQTETETREKHNNYYWALLNTTTGDSKIRQRLVTEHDFNYRIDSGNIEKMVLNLETNMEAYRGELMGGRSHYWPEDMFKQIEQKKGKYLFVQGNGITDTFDLTGIELVRQTLGKECSF
ncbi:hypothetical protein [Candidatus Nitrosacidococcus sp. I8]|uniref:hypothetical protein n=1 Tax=Candidatus Nitrosacidococcus sp. I8 TaxID=2942908 RepID=UPI002226BF69|nr:hypothetical protein [Candidatus Nitrosacidococcus sp. I8]CAH9018731.1 hypothetical protein NURINAE_01101 [Candidatus Nitrosacidococcus sp. I8]